MNTTTTNAQPQPCNVLLVDDNIDIAKIVKAHLNDPKIQLTVSTSARDGIEAFKRSAFDLVLMDIQMPEVDGYEATRTIRFWERQNNRRPTPIAAFTVASSSTLAEVYESGCTHYLPKPISRNVLLQTVNQYFSASRVAA